MPAVLIAASNGHTDCVKSLIAAGADAEKACSAGAAKGCTPLYMAARNDRVAVAKTLVAAGASVDQPIA